MANGKLVKMEIVKFAIPKDNPLYGTTVPEVGNDGKEYQRWWKLREYREDPNTLQLKWTDLPTGYLKKEDAEKALETRKKKFGLT